MPLSFKPSEMVQSSRLFASDPTEITVKEARFIEDDFKGTPTIAFEMVVEDGEGNSYKPNFPYVVGYAERYSIADGGNSVDYNPEYAGDTSEHGLNAWNSPQSFKSLVSSLINAGVPEESMTASVADWVGMKATVQQLSTGKKSASGREVVVLNFIKADPATYGPLRKAAAPKAKAAAATASGFDATDPNAVSIEVLNRIVPEGGSFKVGPNFSQLRGKSLQALNSIKGLSKEVKVEVLGSLFDEAYLSTLEGYEYDNGVLSRS